jgi:hypothetical protein
MPTIKTSRQDCLGSTCLKWSSDGSLSELDEQSLMQRLCLSDPEVKKTGICDIDPINNQNSNTTR